MIIQVSHPYSLSPPIKPLTLPFVTQDSFSSSLFKEIRHDITKVGMLGTIYMEKNLSRVD